MEISFHMLHFYCSITFILFFLQLKLFTSHTCPYTFSFSFLIFYEEMDCFNFFLLNLLFCPLHCANFLFGKRPPSLFSFDQFLNLVFPENPTLLHRIFYRILIYCLANKKKLLFSLIYFLLFLFFLPISMSWSKQLSFCC